ncbi:MAG: hypothetical protein K1X28_07310 [Parachlamydiales bacterium]|nr:hypothetical protein [Parachlamydiales bacterium]
MNVVLESAQFSVELLGQKDSLTDQNVSACKEAAIKYLNAQEAMRVFKKTVNVQNPDANDGLALKISRELARAFDGLKELSKSLNISVQCKREKAN